MKNKLSKRILNEVQTKENTNKITIFATPQQNEREEKL